MKAAISLLVLLTHSLFASVPLKIADEQLAKEADHLFIARVSEVFMKDKKGRLIVNPDAKTGPTSGNVIYLKMTINEVISTNAKKTPKTIDVPLDSFLHHCLGQIKKAHSGPQKPCLLILKGPKFTPIKAGIFKRPLKQKAFFKKHLRKKNPYSPS